MPSQDFKCQSCGRCCIEFEDAHHHRVDSKQVQIWEDNAPHILEWVAEGLGGLYYACWINPYTHDYVQKCPWLRIYKSPRYKNVKGARCLIHGWKPDVCRNFPMTVGQTLRFGCHGFDHLSQARLKKLLVLELVQVLQQIVLNDKINVDLEQTKSLLAKIKEKINGY